MVLQIAAHLCMRKKLWILALHILTQHLVMRRIVAKRQRTILRLPFLEGKQILHRELKILCPVLAPAAICMRPHRLLQRRQRIKHRIHHYLFPVEIGTKYIKTAQRTAYQIPHIRMRTHKCIYLTHRHIHMMVNLYRTPFQPRAVLAQVSYHIRVYRTRKTMNINCFHSYSLSKSDTKILLFSDIHKSKPYFIRADPSVRALPPPFQTHHTPPPLCKR